MKYNAFISYACAETDIVENFRDYLSRFGVTAWAYSIDRTLAVDTWDEIETKIRESDLVIFIVSNNTPGAEGQSKELQLALKHVELVAGTEKIMPIVISGTNFSTLPEELRNKNGFSLDSYKVKSVAWKVAKSAFPSLMEREVKKTWHFPVPGEWLEVSNLDEVIEHYFDIGDKLYFRTISPMGLLECYSPRIKGLFWISHENVNASSAVKIDTKLEESIPKIFKVEGMVEIMQRGWKSWHAERKENEV